MIREIIFLGFLVYIMITVLMFNRAYYGDPMYKNWIGSMVERSDFFKGFFSVAAIIFLFAGYVWYRKFKDLLRR